MAKKSIVARDAKRIRMIEQYAAKRKEFAAQFQPNPPY